MIKKLSDQSQQQQQQQQQSIFNTSKLSNGSLRRYQAFFNMPQTDATQLQSTVAEHYQNELEVDPKNVFDKLVKLKKEERDIAKINTRTQKKNTKAD